MIKKIQIEIIILVFLIINIFLSYEFDLLVFNFFSNLNYGTGPSYLIGFFVGITELGDSLWYFSIIILIFLISLIGIKTKKLSFKNYTNLKNFSIFSFSYLFVVGVVTQVLKHLIGRPRPNHTNFNEEFGFNFFSTDSAFHSFPSGHSSTIIAVVLIISSLFPGLRVFFYIFGFLIAISRVVVGAHFITDVIAGAVVSVILYKGLILFFDKYYSRISITKFEIKNTSTFMNTFIIFFIIALFLTIGFEFDIFFSSLFYYGSNQFLLQSYDVVSIVFRDIFLPFLIVYIFILPLVGMAIPIQQVFFGYKFSLKEIIFVWAAGIITLVGVINLLFKNMWGRVRPDDVLEFGGKDVFTPWYKFGETCSSNCSFVSGDASVGFMLIIFYFLTKKISYSYLALLSGILLGFIRIIAGGHFLSDIVFSQIIVSATVFASFLLYKRLYEN